MNKHIEIIGFIDSGNCLYDNLTRKPVIIISKTVLLRYFKIEEIDQFMKNNCRVITCETISTKNVKIPIFRIKNLILNDKAREKAVDCYFGVVDKSFENSKYDCILHRDFI